MLLSEMVAVHKEINRVHRPSYNHFGMHSRKDPCLTLLQKKLKISHRLALHQLPLMMELESQVTAA